MLDSFSFKWYETSFGAGDEVYASGAMEWIWSNSSPSAVRADFSLTSGMKETLTVYPSPRSDFKSTGVP